MDRGAIQDRINTLRRWSKANGLKLQSTSSSFCAKISHVASEPALTTDSDSDKTDKHESWRRKIFFFFLLCSLSSAFNMRLSCCHVGFNILEREHGIWFCTYLGWTLHHADGQLSTFRHTDGGELKLKVPSSQYFCQGAKFTIYTGAGHIIRISFKKWNLYNVYIHSTQTDIFQVFISFNFDDYKWQLMKTPNSVSQKIRILWKGSILKTPGATL